MKKLVPAVLLALTFLGCAGHEAYVRGQDLMEAGNWEEAVAALDQAVREDPKDNDYRAALEKAKRAAIARRIDLAGQARAAGDLPAAEQHCAAALRLGPSPEAQALRDGVLTERSAVAEQLTRARADVDAGELERAVATLRPIARYQLTFPEIHQLYDGATRTLAAQAMAAALKELARADLIGAREQAQRAVGFRPDDSAAQQLLAKVEGKIESRAALERGVAAMKAGRYRDAVAELSSAVERDPENGQARTELSAARAALAHALSSEAADLARLGRRGSGLSRLYEALAVASDEAALRAEVEKAIRASSEVLWNELNGRGDGALRAGFPGAAWAYYRVASLLGQRAGAGETGRPLPDLSPYLRYRVRVGPTTSGALAQWTAGNLAESLRGRVPAEVAVFSGAGDADAQLWVDVPEARFAHTTPAVEQRSASYIQRIDQVANPRWAELGGQLEQLSRRDRELAEALLQANQRDRALADSELRAQAALTEAERRSTAENRQQVEALQREAGELQLKAALLAKHEPDAKGEEERGGGRGQEGREREEPAGQSKKVQAEAEEKLQTARQRTENPPASPELERARAELERIRRERRELASGQLEPLERQRRENAEDRRNARAALDSTPRLVNVEVPGTFNYEIVTHLLVAEAEGRVQLVDALGDESRLDLAVRARREARDTEFPGARVAGAPDLYLPPDPLELPPAEVFSRDLAADLGTQAVDAVAAALGHHADRFAAAARRGRSADEQLNYWVLAYSARASLSKPSEASAALDAVRASTGLDLERGDLVLERLDR